MKLKGLFDFCIILLISLIGAVYWLVVLRLVLTGEFSAPDCMLTLLGNRKKTIPKCDKFRF